MDGVHRKEPGDEDGKKQNDLLQETERFKLQRRQEAPPIYD
jgi:hypothetical protein